MRRGRPSTFLQAWDGVNMKIWERVSETMWGKRTTEVTEQTGEASTPDLKAPQDCTAGAPALQNAEATEETAETKGLAVGPEASRRAWATQSRKDIRREQFLQKELERCNALKRRAEDTLAGLGGEKKRALELVKGGDSWADSLLRDTLRKIEDEERKLAAFKEVTEKAQSNLDDFRAWMADYAPERVRIQDNLAALAGARLEVDYELERLLREALEMLQVREETIAFMRRQAAAIDLKCSFEAGVPASLHEALSLEIVSASKAWNARFLGEEGYLKPYVVCDENFEPEETLARKAIYHFGETVYMSEEEAAEFLRDDRPQAGGFGWECLPPTLMTAEAFAAAQAEAGPLGKIMSCVLRQRHDELQQKRREAYLLERRGMPVPGVHLHFVP